jgi:tetratricopeptide (TPR) repeat protein
MSYPFNALQLPTEEAARLRQRVGELASTHGFEDVEALLITVDGSWAMRDGDIEKAASLYAEAHKRLAALGRVRDAAMALFDRASQINLTGDLDRAKTAAEEGLAYARQHHIQFAENTCSDFIAAVLLARCDFEAFSALSDERGTDSSYLLALFRAARAEMAGDLETAVSLLPDPRVAGGVPQYLGQLHAGRARVLLNAGRAEQAQLDFALMREGLQSNPAPVPAIVALDEALPALADEHFLKAVLAYPPSHSFDVNGRSAQRTRGLLKLQQGLVDDAEQDFRSALAWCERERCPVEAGRCLQGLAEIAERRGNTAEAMQLLDRAGELFRQHGAKLYLDRVTTRKLQL